MQRILKGRVIRLTVMFLGGVCMTAALLLPASGQGVGCTNQTDCTFQSGGTGSKGKCGGDSKSCNGTCCPSGGGDCQTQSACSSSEYC
jgi:hypothetical protein